MRNLLLDAVMTLMKQSFSAPEDPTVFVTASRRRAVRAYDKWLREQGRAEKGTGVHSDALFIKAVYSLLDVAQNDAPRSLGIPTSRTGWANWRAGRSAPMKRLRLDVCRAIRVLTKIDVTGNQRLANEPVNATDLVHLGHVRAVSTSVGDLGSEIEIVADWVDFKVSAAKDVTRAQSKKNPHPQDKDELIGSVRYALYEASVFVEGGEAFEPVAKQIPSGGSDDDPASRVELALDRDDRLRWRATPTEERDVLKGSVEKLKLARGALEFGDNVTVCVSVARNDIFPIFTASSSKTVTNAEQQRAREELIEQVLRNRFLDNGPRKRFVLSHADAIRDQ